MPAGSGPGAPWGTGVAAVRGREGRGAGPRGAWQRRGVAWGPLAWRTALSFQAPGAGGRRFQARTVVLASCLGQPLGSEPAVVGACGSVGEGCVYLWHG